MDHLVRLQLLNLIKKHEYLVAELEVKSEISAISQAVFWENVGRVVGDAVPHQAAPVAPPKAPPADHMDEAGAPPAEAPGGDALRHAYRSVAKLTHPDRVRSDYLNSLYVEATRCFRAGDEVGLYGIAVRLGVEVDVPESIHDTLLERISELEGRIRFIDSSYHMRWHYSDRQTKIDLVCEYIERNLLRLSEA